MTIPQILVLMVVSALFGAMLERNYGWWGYCEDQVFIPATLTFLRKIGILRQK